MDPVLKAIKEGDEEALKAMIKAGKNLAEPNKEGWLPLHEAAYYGQLGCLKALQQGEAGSPARSEAWEQDSRAEAPSFGASCSLAHTSWREVVVQGKVITPTAELKSPSREKKVPCPHPPGCHLSRPLGTGEPNS